MRRCVIHESAPIIQLTSAAVNMGFSVLPQLVERLRAQHEPCAGDVYGLVCGEGAGARRVGAALLMPHQKGGELLGHPPALLLPPPLTRLGAFRVTTTGGDHAPPQLQEGEVGLLWDQKELHGFLCDPSQGSSSTPQGTQVTPITQEEFQQTFVLGKVFFNLHVSARDAPTALRNSVQALVEELESPAACFRLINSKLILQNSEEGVLCRGGVVDGPEEPVGALFKAGSKKKGATASSTQQVASFQLMMNRSAANTTDAPVVRVESRVGSVLGAMLNGEAIVYLERSGRVGDLAALLARGVCQQLSLAEHWMEQQLANKDLQGSLSSLPSLPSQAGHLVNVMYPDAPDEATFLPRRKQIHLTLLFPLDRPMVRRGNRLTPAPGSRSSALTNTHLGLSSSGVGGAVRTVAGTYSYHHYMQHKFDDNKWGCAYRSLQTIASWLRHQGYTERPVPSHREIQQALVDLGDKPRSFIGSKQWIGSTEVGFVLERLFQVSSRFISVGSGGELSSRGRELATHFETQGTPIMIGGGVLAHTIIGVDWSEDSGDIAFLVLDPHYTGSEDLHTIQSKGWCGWKGPDFWDPAAYYNLCLPQRPVCL